MSKRLSVLVLWTLNDLRCVVITSGEPLTHELQVQRNGVPMLQQSCDNHTDAAEIAGLLWQRFDALAGSPGRR